MFFHTKKLNWVDISIKSGATTTLEAATTCTIAAFYQYSWLELTPHYRRAWKIVVRLIILLLSTEIFSKRRKICSLWRETRVKTTLEKLIFKLGRFWFTMAHNNINKTQFRPLFTLNLDQIQKNASKLTSKYVRIGSEKSFKTTDL